MFETWNLFLKPSEIAVICLASCYQKQSAYEFKDLLRYS